MESEKSVPMSLTGEEVQEAAVAKLRECMQHNCHLRLSDAYTSARIEVTVKMVLSDYGREVRNNTVAEVELDSGIPPESEPRVSEGTVVMEPMPPNSFRVETQQPVPVVTSQDGKKVIKHLKYAARKKADNG